MDIYAKVREQELAKMTKLLRRLERRTKKGRGVLVRMGMIWSLQSAAKATEPGSGVNVSRLKMASRFRPTVKMPGTGFLYLSKRKGGSFFSGGKQNFFRSPKRLLKAEKEGRLLRIRFAVKFWHKKKAKWGYFPVVTSATRKPGFLKNNPEARIRNAGAGKYGWLGSLGKLDNKAYSKGHIRYPSRLHRLFTGKSEKSAKMKATNFVSYIGKTSPNAASTGIRNGRKRMKGYWDKVISKKITRKK